MVRGGSGVDRGKGGGRSVGGRARGASLLGRRRRPGAVACGGVTPCSPTAPGHIVLSPRDNSAVEMDSVQDTDIALLYKPRCSPGVTSRGGISWGRTFASTHCSCSSGSLQLRTFTTELLPTAKGGACACKAGLSDTGAILQACDVCVSPWTERAEGLRTFARRTRNPCTLVVRDPHYLESRRGLLLVPARTPKWDVFLNSRI